MAETPPAPKRGTDSIYIYRLDQESLLPVNIGKVFVDEEEMAWLRIDAEDLAAALGVPEVNGVILLDHNTFEGLES